MRFELLRTMTLICQIAKYAYKLVDLRLSSYFASNLLSRKKLCFVFWLSCSSHASLAEASPKWNAELNSWLLASHCSLWVVYFLLRSLHTDCASHYKLFSCRIYPSHVVEKFLMCQSYLIVWIIVDSAFGTKMKCSLCCFSFLKYGIQCSSHLQKS